VVVNAANPPVKDRINSMNAMFCNGNGERRYKVNVARCPVYTEAWNSRYGRQTASRINQPTTITQTMLVVISS
jgi:hypothetical protein